MGTNANWLVAYFCPNCGTQGEATFSQNAHAFSGKHDGLAVGPASDGFRIVERGDQSGLPVECVQCGVYAERRY